MQIHNRLQRIRRHVPVFRGCSSNAISCFPHAACTGESKRGFALGMQIDTLYTIPIVKKVQFVKNGSAS